MIEESSISDADLNRVDNQKTVASYPHLGPQTSSTATPTDGSDSASVDADGRYQLKDEIARGGMGVIVHSRDNELQRDLAIKYLRKSKADYPGASLRFVEEAQIAGQLQHPGIVPIYDVGQLEDGRPFFSMKLVKGQTLAQILNKRSTLDQDLIRYLGIFEQICQAIAYAHSRHVIHRDLKPANIMVGAFGEVQVMDWGLAKVIDGDFSLDEIFESSETDSIDIRDVEHLDETNDSSIRTTREIDRAAGVLSPDLQAQTQLGSVVGTLAYMPPEQAKGQVDQIKEGVDVFALGAILACILTGKPPYVNPSSEALHRMAEDGDLKACYERIDACGCDLRLQAILRNALAPETVHRTPDAGTLALEISGYIASVSDRLNEAKVESAAAKAREEEAIKATVRVQRRSKITMLMAAIAVLASVLAGVGAFVAQHNQTARLDAENASRIAAAEFAAEASMRQQEITRELENQLVVCEAFLEQSNNLNASRPDNDSLQRIQKLMNDFQHKLGTELIDAQLKQRHKSLAERLKSLETAIRLVDQLEEHRTAIVADELDGSAHYQFVANRREKIVVSKSQIHSARFYKLFSDWLDSFTDQTRHLAAEKILEMPPWAQPPVIDGLKELQRSYRAPDSGMLANAAKWQPLKMTDHHTNGSQLSQLSDGSILASGPVPDGDHYALTFSSDVNHFSAFKIEALTDPSLPMMGPGRSSEGDFTICWMEFDVASRETADANKETDSVGRSFFEPTYCEAFTTFQSPLSVFDPKRWHCVMAPSKDQQTILILDEPAEARNGFDIKLHLQFNSPGKWGDQSLGRFRVSVAAVPDRDTAATFAAEAGEIADQVIAGRANLWEQEYWQAREESTGDALVAELLRLASTPTFKQQHSVYTIRLAEILKEQSESWWINQMNQQCEWHVIEKEPETDIETESLSDGSWLVGETDKTNSEITGSYQHAFRFQTPRPVRYLKFESIRDESLPNGGPGRGVGTGEFAIAEFKLLRNGQPTTLDTAQSNFPPSVETDIGRATDSNTLTFWRPQHPTSESVRTAIFPVSRNYRQDGLLEYELVIVSGRPSTSEHDSLGRFRISWSGDPTDVASQNPAGVAMEILDDQYMRDPANYPTLVSLTRAAALKNPPDHESAANYGWTAYALKPDDPNSISIAVRTILRRNPKPGSAELSRAILLARKAREIDFKSGALEQVFSQQLEVANAHYGQRQFQQAERAFRTTYDLIPENFPFPGRWGHCLTEIGELDRAREVLLKRYRDFPDNHWLRVHLAHNAIARKEFDLAEEYIDPVVEAWPKNLIALMFKVKIAEERGSFSEVIRLLGKHEEVAPLTALGTGYLYRALFASERIKEVADELPKAFIDWPKETELQHDVCLIMAANDQIEQLTDNLYLLNANRPEQLNQIIESVFFSEIQLPEKERFGAHGFRSLDTVVRFYQSAVEVQPNSDLLNRLNCVVKLKQQKWELALEAISRGRGTESRFSLLAKAWCQFELGNRKLASELAAQSLTADANLRPQEFQWLQNQLAKRADEPDSSILQIFGPAIQMVTPTP